MKNIFIVFEGIDGSGTSTQANLLCGYFLKNRQRAVVTSEPSPGPIGNLIREGLKRRVVFTHEDDKFDQQMAYLFAADRHDHLYNEVDGVFKLLNEGHNVISTRYYFSSMAYHCDTPRDRVLVSTLNANFPKPDLLIYIDNPVELSIERLLVRPFWDRYENVSKLERVKQNYDEIVASYDGQKLSVRGDLLVTEIHQTITDYLEQTFNYGH